MSDFVRPYGAGKSQVAIRIQEGKYHVAYGGTCLAIRDKHYRLFCIFLKHVPNIDAKLDGGRTLLHFAAEMGCELQVFKLVQTGSDIYLKDNNGNTPYKLARTHFFLQNHMRFERTYRCFSCSKPHE